MHDLYHYTGDTFKGCFGSCCWRPGHCVSHEPRFTGLLARTNRAMRPSAAPWPKPETLSRPSSTAQAGLKSRLCSIGRPPPHFVSIYPTMGRPSPHGPAEHRIPGIFLHPPAARILPRMALTATAILGTSAGWIAYSFAAVPDLPMSVALSAASYSPYTTNALTSAGSRARCSV